LLLPQSSNRKEYQHKLIGKTDKNWDGSNWDDVDKGSLYYSVLNPNGFKTQNTTLAKVYPAITSGFIAIKYTDFSNNFTFELFDIQGCKVFSKLITEKEYSLNLAQLRNGICFYKIQSSNNTETGKVVKNSLFMVL
jgi:hypothetical protein